MADFVKQHYLPAVYLQNFCIPSQNPDRRATIWRFDGVDNTEARVGNQCFENYCYSKAEAAFVEKDFAEIESAYGAALGRLQRGERLLPSDHSIILIAMIQFHIRNPALQNMTGQEGIVAYRLRAAHTKRLFMNLARGEDVPTDEEVKNQIESYWALRILLGPGTIPFCTSDNPSVWLSFSKENPRLDLIILPLTPFYLAAAFDKRSWRITDKKVSESDATRMNVMQYLAAERFMFSCIKIDSNGTGPITGKFGGTDRERPKTTLKHMDVRLLRWREDRPTFLQEAAI